MNRRTFLRAVAGVALAPLVAVGLVSTRRPGLVKCDPLDKIIQLVPNGDRLYIVCERSLWETDGEACWKVNDHPTFRGVPVAMLPSLSCRR